MIPSLGLQGAMAGLGVGCAEPSVVSVGERLIPTDYYNSTATVDLALDLPSRQISSITLSVAVFVLFTTTESGIIFRHKVVSGVRVLFSE